MTSGFPADERPARPVVRAATEADLAAINDIYNHYVLHSTATYQTEPGTRAERLEWFRAHDAEHPVVVAVEPATRQIVGWASLSRFHSRCAYRCTVEDSVYIHHGHHRRGIGKVLLTHLVGRARALQHRTIIAVISADQAPSMALHAALGFSQAGLMRQVGYKFERWLDVATMQLLL